MKVWNYLLMLTGIALLMSMAGIPIDAGILSKFGLSLSGATSNNLVYLAIFGAAGALVGLGAGLVIGYFTKSSSENYVILGLITGTLAPFSAVLYGIINYAVANYDSWVYYTVMLVLSPLAIGYIWALVETFRGTD